jgi:hypothetical protein
MSARTGELVQRRRQLRARCAVQRNHLAETSAKIEEQLGSLDRGVQLARSVISSPVVLVGGIALVAFLGPRKILRLASRGLLLLTTARRVTRMLQASREL